ncbi:MAG: hypothetical protein PWQ57_251 [Desulfovibrionales bacterium]|nr:hypothetical protein [Desulfovibrionales bacterium]
MQYQFEFLELEQLGQLQRILYDFFGENYYGAHVDYFNWQYRDSLFSESVAGANRYTVFVAREDDRILALDAFLPWKTYIRKEPIQTMWDIEWINTSDIKGIGRKLVAELRSHFEMYCGYGLNAHSTTAYGKLGFRINDSIERMVAILDAERCIEEFGVINDAEKVSFYKDNQAQYAQSSWDILTSVAEISEAYWEDALSNFCCISYKGPRYLDWRYLRHPFLKYHLISLDSRGKSGIAAVRLEQIRGRNAIVLRILDFLPCSGKEKELAVAVCAFGRKHRAILADFFCASSRYAQQLLTVPFLPLSFHSLYEVPMLFQPLEVRKRKSINMVWDFQKHFGELGFDDFYATKADGDQDVFINPEYSTVSF